MSDMKPNPCPACGKPAEQFENVGNKDLWGCPPYRGCPLGDELGAVPLAFWNRLRLAPAASDETIPVRIAVVVDEGDWYGACGWINADDTDLIKQASNYVDASTTRITFITALAYRSRPQPAMEVTGDSQPV